MRCSARHTEHGQRQVALFKHMQQTPDARARTLFIQRFHAHVACRGALSVSDFREKGFRTGVGIKHAIFAAFFIIENELQCNAGLIRPLRMRRCAAVAGQVAWIIVIVMSCPCLTCGFCRVSRIGIIGCAGA